MPIYEFVCESCGHRFEELVGSHVGLRVEDLVCPECGSAAVERQIAGSYASLRQLTPNQKRRLEERRGIDRDGARDRFSRRRAAERAAGRRRGGS